RMVQQGEDLRHVTAEALKHYRNLLLAQTAPGQPDLLDVPTDEYDRIRAQAAKFTPPELSRIIALLLAAQTDMRWTTSPRLTLELALIRASMPESDPTPDALISRMERLERLAGLDSGAGSSPPAPAEAVVDGGDPREQPLRSAPLEEVSDADRVRSGGAPVDEQASADTPATTPPSTGKVDVDMLRRSW